MKLLTNPLILRGAMVFIATAVAFIVGLIVIRQLRRSLQAEASLGEGSHEGLPLHTYHAVIQQLKQQKHELQTLQQAERRRAQASENISAAVLSNLSSGVLVFNNSGLVRQANPAAKAILGFASPVGMNAGDLFRDATVRGGLNSERTPLSEAIAASLKTLSKFHRLEADYMTPGGDLRILEITISPVYAATAEILGAACLITDHTEIARMREGTQLRSGISELAGTIEKILDRAKALHNHTDADTVACISAEIMAEAEHARAAISGASSANAVATASGAN